MAPLPAVAYEISSWVYWRRVAKNRYVTWKRNFYSVPVKHIGTVVDLRITETTMEIYCNTERLTSHVLLGRQVINQYQTNDTDIPTSHAWQPWTAQRGDEWAHRVGPATVSVVERIFESVAVPELGLDAALAVLRLSRRYGLTRLENACQIALRSHVHSPRYVHLAPILETGQVLDSV